MRNAARLDYAVRPPRRETESIADTESADSRLRRSWAHTACGTPRGWTVLFGHRGGERGALRTRKARTPTAAKLGAYRMRRGANGCPKRNAARLNSLFQHRGGERNTLRMRKVRTTDCGEAERIPHAERRAAEFAVRPPRQGTGRAADAESADTDCGEAGRIPYAERRAAGLRYSITATAAAKPPVCVIEISTLCAPSA